MAPPSTSKSHFPPPPAVPLDAPVGTKESFEKELQNLAAKAKEETRSKWIKEQSSVLLKSGTLLTLAAIYSNISQLTLSPVYGGIPSSIYHSKGVMTACFLGWSTNLVLKRNLPVKPVTLLPIVAAYIPLIQFFAFKLSDFLGAVYGPPITEALTFFPLLLLSVGCTATVLDDLELTSGTGRFKAWTADAGPGIGSYAFFKSIEYLSSSYLNDVIGSTLVLSRVGLQLLLTSVFALFSPSKLLLYTLPALIHTVGFNTHFQAPWTTASLEASLNRDGWSLIDRQDSNTGLISVVENQRDGFRAMRCDHSLLGGEWLRSPDGTKVKEPIYGVFVMLEAVRLIEVPEPKVKDVEANALVIGLGIGTTPAALMAHGIWTTIVEIDPVVHDFAMKYFGLPETHTKVIENAVTFADQVAGGFPHLGFQGRKFDYIVHDVFTGGAEPVELFTREFLQDLKTMLTPDGVIAINYAGDFMLPPARIIVKTIKSVFPTCRIFRESPKPSAAVLEEEKRDFTNMVIFCVNSPETKKVTFREPIEADLLGSNARRAFLKPKHEVPGSRFKEKEGDGGVLYRNGTERFKQWQQQSAVGHWKVMRGVLPTKIWEDW